MNFLFKTRKDLIKELTRLEIKYDKLKTSYEKDISETRQEKAKLAEDDKNYYSLFNAIDEGFCIIEVIFDENKKPIDYRFLEINSSYERQTGLINAKGRRMRELKPEHEEHWFEIYGKIALSGKPLRFEHRSEQLYRWYDVYAFRVGQQKNRQVAILFTDINERKQVEMELKISEKKYRFIVENVGEGIGFVNADEEFVLANPAAERIFGVGKGELIGKNIREFLSKEQYMRILNQTKIHRRGQNSTYEFELTRHDGNKRTVSITAVPQFDSKKMFIGTHCIFRDFTEIRNAEEALTLQNDKLSILNNLAIELSNLSLHDNLEEFIAKKAREIYGAEATIFSDYNSENRTTTPKGIEMKSGMQKKVESLLGRKIESIHSFVSDDIYHEISVDLIRKKKTLSEASFGSISRQEGTAIEALLGIDRTIGLAYIIDGKLYGTSLLAMRKDQPDPPRIILENFIHLVGTSLQRKKDEVELKKKMVELVSVNKELEQFAHANAELEQFAFIASHNLQQPLRTISNYMQIFEEDYIDKIDDKGHEYLHVINNAAKRMILQLDSLLDFSRLGRNLKLSKVDCKKIIDSVVADLETMIVASDATIEVTKMPELNVYESEFSQLFQNLIVNAIKFQKPDSRPKIKISSEKFKTQWKFSINDNGIGIPPKSFHKIFDIFQRLHKDAEYEGHGIGLAFCKKIVQLHKGDIWVESTVGQGTTFNFTIANLTE